MREHGDEEIAPAEVLVRRRSGDEVSRLLTGLLARNLTTVPNAAHFNGLRDEILRDIEQQVIRLRGLPAGTQLFDRSRLRADSGPFALGRIIVNIEVQALLTSVQQLLSSDSSLPFSQERSRLIHRIWRLLLWLRSAGAESHRSAASLTIRHTYQADGALALTGSTGNAVNSHVHIETRLLRAERQVGTCLPHEFFPLRGSSAAEAAADEME